jgi:energy-coupling factor transporter transmembrane protein EcfT
LLAGNGPLARVPPVAAFVVVIAVFVVAIVVRGGLGAALLGLLALAVGVLLAATWRVLPAPARFGRVAVFAILVAVAVSMLLSK